MIPKIIHQTWIDESIPPELQEAQQSWQKFHPDWEYRFWTDQDNRQFIAMHYPWFLSIYDNYPYPIMRVDAWRYFVMHHYGGIYADLDFLCLRPLDSLLLNKSLVFGLEPEIHHYYSLAAERQINKLVCNAFIAGVPRHPFWTHIFESLQNSFHLQDLLAATGPLFLTKAYEGFAEKTTINLEAADTLYPIHLYQTLNDLPLNSRAYAVHLWYHSWWKDDASRSREQRMAKALKLMRMQKSWGSKLTTSSNTKTIEL